MKVKEPELGTLVAREYRYDHFAVHSPEYGFPEGEKVPVSPGACLRTPGAEEEQVPVFGAQSSLIDGQMCRPMIAIGGLPCCSHKDPGSSDHDLLPPHSRVTVPVLGQAQGYVSHPETQRAGGRTSLFCFQDKPYIQGPSIHRTSSLRGAPASLPCSTRPFVMLPISLPLSFLYFPHSSPYLGPPPHPQDFPCLEFPFTSANPKLLTQPGPAEAARRVPHLSPHSPIARW